MTPFRRYLSLAAVALVFVLAANGAAFSSPAMDHSIVLFNLHSVDDPETDRLAKPDSQSSPTETPVPTADSFEISHIDGNVLAIRMVPVCGNDDTSNPWCTFVNSSAVERFCDEPENAQRCERFSDTLDGSATLSAGDEIFTGDESGAILELSNGIKILLAQDTALAVVALDGSLDVPDVHLRLDAGLLAILPGADLPSGSHFQIALTDEAVVDAIPSDEDQPHMPGIALGHDPESGDVLVTVLDGTAVFHLGDDTVEIPAGKRSEVKDSHDGYPNAQINPLVEPMIDQDLTVWVGALHYGEIDPAPFSFLAPHLDSEPVWLNFYRIDPPSREERHYYYAVSEGTHTTGDEPTDTQHDTGEEHQDGGDISHTEGGHNDSSGGEHSAATERPSDH